MGEAIHAGWETPPEIATEVEKLRGVHAERHAQRLTGIVILSPEPSPETLLGGDGLPIGDVG